MATGPKIASSPLELLDNDSYVTEPLLTKYFNPIICGTVGLLAVMTGNWASRRPVWSGIQKHVGFTVGGAYIGKLFDDRKRRYYADRDAIFRHYIELHPDDFPPYERKQYKDLLESWVPIR